MNGQPVAAGRRAERRTVLMLSADAGLADRIRALLASHRDAWEMTCSGDRIEAWARLGECNVCLLDASLPDALAFLGRARDSGMHTPIIWLGGNPALAETAVEKAGAIDRLALDALDELQLLRALRYASEQSEAGHLLREGDRRLREASRSMQDLLEDYSDALVVCDRTGRTVYSNLAAVRLFGRDHLDIVIDDYPELRLGEPGIYEVEMDLGQQWRTLVVQLYDISWGGDPVRLLSLRDVTEQRSLERRLLLAFRVINASRHGIFVVDALADDFPVVFANPAFEQIAGLPMADMDGRPAVSVLGDHAPRDAEEGFLHALRGGGTFTATTQVTRRDGTNFWAETSLSPVQDNGGSITHYVGLFDDVSERVNARLRLEWLSSHHMLCGLYNQNGIRPVADALLRGVRMRRARVAALWINLDDFHLINEVYGHRMGDNVIVEMAARLRNVLGHSSLVARLDGDEFMAFVVSDSCGDFDELANRVMREVSRPLVQSGLRIQVSCCIGIAVDDGQGDAMALARNADIAMHHAKDSGPGCLAGFTPAMATRPQRIMGMRVELQRAVDEGQFVLLYQPQVDARSGLITGLEALVRWRHPERGLLAPDEFLPDAEYTGQIHAIGSLVLAMACRDCATMNARGLQDIRVSVNVASAQFHSEDFCETVREVLERTGLPPALLELELNEATFPRHAEEAIRRVVALRQMGVRIAIDRFGSGAADIGALQVLPVNKIKMDRSFCQNITSDSRAAAIVGGVVSMAHNLGVVVVADGVETAGQRDYLRRLNCDILQGFFFSLPVEMEQVVQMVTQVRSGMESATRPAGSEDARTLLLVDDEPNILRALSRLLRRDGYRILTASSARDAFSILASNDVHVIISDQRMPEMCGTEFLAQVKGLYPDTVRIVLSGYTDLNTVTAAINEGAIWRFLTKPWSDDALREDVRKAFAAHFQARTDERGHG